MENNKEAETENTAELRTENSEKMKREVKEEHIVDTTRTGSSAAEPEAVQR